jgi:hypothetical protein
MSNENPFVGPGKLFATDEEEMAERIELWEWASQKSDEEFARFFCALQDFVDSKKVSDGDDTGG